MRTLGEEQKGALRGDLETLGLLDGSEPFGW
jgi:hypothetical protein